MSAKLKPFSVALAPVVLTTAALAAVSVILFAARPAVAGNNNAKKNAVSNATKQADAANKAAAQSNAQAGAAHGGVAAANDALKAAQDAYDEANKALKKIEDDTIDAQSADTDFGKARDTYRAAEKKYQEARKSVLEDPTFKDRMAKARESDDVATALLALKKEFDEMPAIADSRGAMTTARDVYDPLKTKLLEGTSDWVTANDDYKAKKQALDEARHAFSEASASAARAKSAALRAEKAAAAAAAAKQNAQNQPTSKKRGRTY